MMPFSLFLALKYLRPKRTVLSVVTVISIIGVLLGVAILVIVMGVMTGFDDMWRDKILSFRPHITVMSRFGAITQEEELCQALEQVDGVTGAAPVIQTLAMVTYERYTSAPTVIGVDPERVGLVSKVTTNIVWGTFDLDDRGVVLGIDEARKLGLHIGDKLLVYSEVVMQGLTKDELYLPEELTVRGVFDMGMQKFDEGHLITSLEVARDLVGIDEGCGQIYIMTDDPVQFEIYTERVRALLGSGFVARSWNEIDRVLFEALQVEKMMMFILLAFITIVAIFCVANTLIVITVQKTNEIGLLKALGFRSNQVMAAFVWHGWVQCLVGIAVGLGLGVLVLHNMQNLVALLAKCGIAVFPKAIYGLDAIPYHIRWDQDIPLIVITVMVFCTLASLLPAWRASRMDPVNALRQE